MNEDKYKIKRNNPGNNRHNHHKREIRRFPGMNRGQKMLILLAVLLWLTSFVRMVSKDIVREVSADSSKDMVSVFCDNVYQDTVSRIRAYGVLTESYLSDDAKRVLLEDIASDIGLNNYKLMKSNNRVDRTDNSGSEVDGNVTGDNISKDLQEKLKDAGEHGNVTGDNISSRDSGLYELVQESVYGDVCIKIVYSQEKYYLIIDMQLDKGIDSTLQYRNIIENVCNSYGVDCSVNMCLKGSIDGQINVEERRMVSDALLKGIGAKEVQSRKNMDIFTVYAWDRNEKSVVMLGNKKINVNVTMEYNEENDKTEIYLATPIYID